MSKGFIAFTCPNAGCDNGVIEVFYAYSDDPLAPVREPCDVCQGTSFIAVPKSEVVSALN